MGHNPIVGEPACLVVAASDMQSWVLESQWTVLESFSSMDEGFTNSMRREIWKTQQNISALIHVCVHKQVAPTSQPWYKKEEAGNLVCPSFGENKEKHS